MQSFNPNTIMADSLIFARSLSAMMNRKDLTQVEYKDNSLIYKQASEWD